MPGAIVTSPKGWERGPAVESSEGCLYPTWRRVDMSSFKEKVLKLSPGAKCLKSKMGYKIITKSGKVICGGPTAPLAWKFAYRKLEKK